MSTEIIVILLMLFFSAFFSGTEIALLGISPYQVTGKGKEKLRKLLQQRDNLISTMLIGNNITIVAATLALNKILGSLDDPWLKFGAFSAQTLLFFFAGEALPKNLFRKINYSALNALYPVIQGIYYLFLPLSKILMVITKKLFEALPKNEENKETGEDLIYFIGSHFVKEDTPIARGLLSLKNTLVREIMTPLPEIFSLASSINIADATEVIQNTAYSRYPVYKDRGDNIIGYINVFDILGTKPSQKISTIMYDPVFIPDTLKANELLFRMLRQQWPMVFIVNEYGIVTGMVSLENIAEEIVGDEIMASEQIAETPDVVPLENGAFLLDGNLDIDDFNQYFQLFIEKQGFETITGYLCHICGYIPRMGEIIEREYGSYEIVEASQKTLDLIRYMPNAPKI